MRGGLPTLRAFRAEDAACAELRRRADAHTRVLLAGLRADSWLMVRAMLLAVAFYVAVALGIVLHAARHGLLARAGAWALRPQDSAFLVPPPPRLLPPVQSGHVSSISPY